MGLIESIENALTRAGYNVVRVGWPLQPHGGTPLLDLTWNGFTMRSHQDEAFTKSLERLRRGQGTILEMPTASGKSLPILALIKEFGTPTLVLVHQKKLMDQWNEGIQKTLDWKPALYGDNKKEIGPIVVGMVQSIANAPNFPINNFNFVIVDEVHRTPAMQTYKILMKSNAYYKYGVSATAFREQGDELKMFAAIGPVIKVSSIKELIKKGVLAKPTIEFINAPRAQEGETYADAYKKQIVMNMPRNVLIANKANELATTGLSVLVTVNQIKHGKTLEKMIPGSKFVHGTTKTKDRNKILKDFEEGRLKVVISTIVKEGIDIPTMNVLICAAGGKSEGATMQRIGRALRTTKDKKTALIIDVLDNGHFLRDHAQGRVMLYKETF